MATMTALITMIFLISTFTTATSISELELESMLTALRSKGYNLFGNGIITSDIRYQVYSGASFTFFAPTDVSVFAFGMTAPAHLYVSTLRYHVIPGKLKIRELHSLPSGSTLQTLLPDREVAIGSLRSPGSNLVTVNGVDVVVPGLFYSKNVAVHGLNGILQHRSLNRASPPRLTPSSQTDLDLTRFTPSPSPGTESDGVIDFLPESSDPVSFPPEFSMSPPVEPPILQAPVPSPAIESDDVIDFLPESSDPVSFPPEFSMSPPVEPPILQTPVPSPAIEFVETQPSDLDFGDQPRVVWGVESGSDYDPTQSELRVTKKCKEGSKCGKLLEDAWWMREGGTPAMSPDFSWILEGETPVMSRDYPWMKDQHTPAMTPGFSRDRKTKGV